MRPLRAIEYARRHRHRFVAELKDFVRFPTVSSQAKHAADIDRCAVWLAGRLKRAGMGGVRVVPTGGHPLVYAASEKVPGRPTVLVYGHYDVQPADPLREWRSPPFLPEVRGQNLYGRGACDDKGQMFAHVIALESWLMTERALPVNVKCIFEGEEEIGSPNLSGFIDKNNRALRADVAVLSDTRMLAPDRPAISYAERGTLSIELEVQGPEQDLHSGNFGGAVHNPLQVVSDLLAGLHDASGRVAIPGFYRKVRLPANAERDYMARVGPSDEEIMRDARVSQAWGEPGFSLYERTTLRPALTLNGVAGGYQGPGVKAVIPARAVAKLSFRLVPDQDPREIENMFRRHIRRVSPSTVKTVIRASAFVNPVVLRRDHPAVRAAALAYRNAFGSAPVFLRSGGTIPVVGLFREKLEIPTVLMGFALPGDRMHAPNEKFHLPNFYKGTETCIHFLHEMSKASNGLSPAQISEGSLTYGH
ncbi:MAG: dipeptidase [Acidobacteriaceae bacterium]|nr:dipeptidase [Acidobacteriaceae bacterium]